MGFPLKVKLFFITIICLCLSPSLADNKRKLTTTFWPNCDDFKEYCKTFKYVGDNVVYTKGATPHHDDLHYIFSTIGVPTILVVRTTGGDAEMYLNWDEAANSSDFVNCISFKSTTKEPFKIEYKFGVAFTKLIEYNDKDDGASLDHCLKKPKSCDFIIRDFRDFIWDTLPDKATDNTFVFNSTSDAPVKKSNNGSVSFSFLVRDKDGRASELPSLKYSANETQFDFVLSNYTPSYDNSRFALESIVVSSSKPDHMLIDGTQTIDDEYSPGVFKIVNWQADHKQQANTGFFQWKPVSYFGKNRGRMVGTEVRHYKLTPIDKRAQDKSQVMDSFLYPFFGKDMFVDTDVAIRLTNISFGMPKDKFYTKNNFTAWSAAVGYGTPPKDVISTMVIIVISAGLGIPVLIIIFGGAYTICRKMRGQSSYQPINGRGSNLQVN